jgi:hypothetical protein
VAASPPRVQSCGGFTLNPVNSSEAK